MLKPVVKGFIMSALFREFEANSPDRVHKEILSGEMYYSRGKLFNTNNKSTRKLGMKREWKKF
jgi:hypothetical protein